MLPSVSSEQTNRAKLITLGYRKGTVDSGVLASARAGCVHILMSTISPAKTSDFLEIMTNAGFREPYLQAVRRQYCEQELRARVTLTLGLKDVNLALDAAKTESIRGLGSRDWSILAEVIRRRAHIEDGVRT